MQSECTSEHVNPPVLPVIIVHTGALVRQNSSGCCYQPLAQARSLCFSYILREVNPVIS